MILRSRRFLFRIFAAVIALTTCVSWILIYLLAEKPSSHVSRAGTVAGVEEQLKNLEQDLNQQKDESQKVAEMLQKMGLVKGPEKDDGGKDANKPRPEVSDQAAPPAQAPASLFGTSAPPIPILVIACNRPSISRCLDKLLEYRPQGMEANFPIYVSQDCGDEPTAEIISGYGSKLTHLKHVDATPLHLEKKDLKWKGYYLIARHYRWAINQMLQVRNYTAAIIVEDDLEIAPDFFEYFLAMYPLLKRDESLFCVSAWNDNGKKNLINLNATDLLYRSDFFPGLGWMLTREVWQEWEPKWPKGYWDDWVRQPDQRKERACIRPEISRTSTFGRKGVSLGQFFDKHLKFIVLNEAVVHFTQTDISYLLKENYDKEFLKTVYTSPVVELDQLRFKTKLPDIDVPVRITYNSRPTFKRITKALGLMDDFKSGVPRTAYHGVISLFFNNRRVYLAPPPSWKAYDVHWA